MGLYSLLNRLKWFSFQGSLHSKPFQNVLWEFVLRDVFLIFIDFAGPVCPLPRLMPFYIVCSRGFFTLHYFRNTVNAGLVFASFRSPYEFCLNAHICDGRFPCALSFFVFLQEVAKLCTLNFWILFCSSISFAMVPCMLFPSCAGTRIVTHFFSFVFWALLLGIHCLFINFFVMDVIIWLCSRNYTVGFSSLCTKRVTEQWVRPSASLLLFKVATFYWFLNRSHCHMTCVPVHYSTAREMQLVSNVVNCLSIVQLIKGTSLLVMEKIHSVNFGFVATINIASCSLATGLELALPVSVLIA